MNVEPVQTFASVWDAIEDTPAEAAHLRLRSELAIAIGDAVAAWRLTPSEAATRLGVTQARLNDLLDGGIARFSLDVLVKLAEHAGLAVRIEITRSAA
jgi:predicted XRE-type DNA-binding protein